MKQTLLAHLNMDENSIILDFGTGPILKEADSWKRIEYVEKIGRAAMPG